MRPTWNKTFMDMAVVLSKRSHDPDTKHGAIIVDFNNVIVGAGYNGYPRGCDVSTFPDTRPAKYGYMVHAEQNAIIHCHKRPANCTMYVTGLPCPRCFLEIIQSGIKTVVFGAVKSSCVTESDEVVVNHLARECEVRLVRYTE